MIAMWKFVFCKNVYDEGRFKSILKYFLYNGFCNIASYVRSKNGSIQFIVTTIRHTY